MRILSIGTILTPDFPHTIFKQSVYYEMRVNALFSFKKNKRYEFVQDLKKKIINFKELSDWEIQRDIEFFHPLVYSLKMSQCSEAGLVQSQEPRTPARPPIWMAWVHVQLLSQVL